MFDVNLFGVVEVTHAFLPLLLTTKGRVLIVSSVLAVMPMPFQSTYNMSKAALVSFGDTLRMEMAPFGYDLSSLSAFF